MVSKKYKLHARKKTNENKLESKIIEKRIQKQLLEKSVLGTETETEKIE